MDVTPPRQPAPECARASAALPDQVAGHERRTTRPPSSLTAAWGDPAVIAVCGVPELGPTTQECIAVDDVDWVVEELSDGARFTTFGTRPALEVLVPDAYAPEPLLLPYFAAAAKALPRNGRSCT